MDGALQVHRRGTGVLRWVGLALQDESPVVEVESLVRGPPLLDELGRRARGVFGGL